VIAGHEDTRCAQQDFLTQFLASFYSTVSYPWKLNGRYLDAPKNPVFGAFYDRDNSSAAR